MLLALYYRQPTVGAWSIPGTVLVADALGKFSLSELVGAYSVSDVLVVLLALTGVLRRVMRWLPFPIVMAMIAGALVQFAIRVVESAESTPWIVAAAVIGCLVFARFVPWIPGVVGALLTGMVAAGLTGALTDSAPMCSSPRPLW